MYCKYCGNKINEGDRFCTKCGKSLKKQPADVRVNDTNAGEETMQEAQKRVSKPVLIAVVAGAVLLSAIVVFVVFLFTGIVKKSGTDKDVSAASEESSDIDRDVQTLFSEDSEDSLFFEDEGDPITATDKTVSSPDDGETDVAEPAAVEEAASEDEDAAKETSVKNTDIHTYEVFTEDITWTAAYDRCRQMGGHLARIDSDEENEFISELLRSKGVTGIAYIGGKREPEDRAFHWVGDDRRLFDYDVSSGDYRKYWLEGEPSYHDEVNGMQIDECYMSMLYKKSQDKWLWNDVCDDVRSLSPLYYTGKISYICEYE